jgi:DtxR family Mn-dependent transcriptional regulator
MPKEFPMSESEDMYLLTVAMLVEAGVDAPIPVSRLAQELSIQPVSANQMIRKLEESGLVLYTPYKGVVLTLEGGRRALCILRHRRLWEVFLVENLKMTPVEANELACRLEHILRSDVAERLSEYLGSPAISPQGKPIPDLTPNDNLPRDIFLSQLMVGQRSQVTQVDTDVAARGFLSSEGIQSGAVLTVLGIGNGGATLIGVEGRSVFLGEGLAQKIRVKMPDAFPGDP